MFDKALINIGDFAATALAALLGVIGMAMETEKSKNWLYDYYLEDDRLRQSELN